VLEQEVRLTPDLAQHLRVVDTLGPSPIPPLVVSRRVPPELRRQLRDALLAMHTDPLGVQVLESAHMARLVPVVDADYHPIRRMAAAAAAVHSPW
jgi:phosphonate transport system substrate-binding protein